MIPFINSIPKSGTNLLQKTLELFGFTYGKLGLADSLLLGRHYLVRQMVRGSKLGKNPINIGLTLNNSISDRWLERRLTRMKRSQYITGHANYSGRLKYILDKYDVRTLYVVRDPRDVLVSWAHYVEKRQDMIYHAPFYRGMSFEERLQLLLHGGFDTQKRLYFESFKDILWKMNPWMELDNVCKIRFEDLVGPRGGGSAEEQRLALSNIASFLELKDITPERLDGIAEGLFGGTHTFRKGQIGSWRDELSSETISDVEVEIGSYLNQWGYSR